MNRVAAASAAIAFVLLLAIGAQSAAAPAPGADLRHDRRDPGARHGDADLLEPPTRGAGGHDRLDRRRTRERRGRRPRPARHDHGQPGRRRRLGAARAAGGRADRATRRAAGRDASGTSSGSPSTACNRRPSTSATASRSASGRALQVLGDVARVLVSARQHYTFPNGTEGAEPWHQYLLVLERAPESRYGWLLIERTASQARRAGSESVADR